nr:lung seven transmembrane receptor family protein [Tanacetum cinerariifolium]
MIYAILFEVDDRETIGGSAYGGQRAICCTADLAKLGACKEGEIIHRLSTTNPGWPQVFGVSFDVNEETATLQPRSVQITRTGMYNLYFMHCEPRLDVLGIFWFSQYARHWKENLTKVVYDQQGLPYGQ